MEEKHLELLLKLGQFIIGTVVLGIASIVVNYQFQQREIEVKELEQLGKFVEQAIDENVAKRQRFAGYFATVSRSDIARERWQAYKDKLDIEHAKFEAEKETLKQKKVVQIQKAEAAYKDLQFSFLEVEKLNKHLASLTTSNLPENLQNELNAKRNELQLAQNRQFESEQLIASLELQLEETTQQLQYPVKKPVVEAGKAGWVFLGTYDNANSVWTNAYFNIDFNTPPKKLQGTKLEVVTTAINVRSGMPNTFGKNAPLMGALKKGASVNVLTVLPWSHTGFIWARVNY